MSLQQFDEQKDQVAVEQILRVVFLDVDRPSPVCHIFTLLHFFHINLVHLNVKTVLLIVYVIMSSKQLDKLKRQLAEAEAALEARKKTPEDTGPRIVGEGLVIDEWVIISSILLDLTLWYFSFSHLLLFCFRKNEGRDIWLGNKLKWLIQCKVQFVYCRKLLFWFC